MTDPVTRTGLLLDQAMYLTLATTSPDGTPWAAVLQYAWSPSPLRFVFGSATSSLHSQNIATTPTVAGSLFTTAGVEFTDIDGAQFTGHCAELGPSELDRYHDLFYRSVFPDPEQRAEWTLPPERLLAPAPHRLYVIDVERWWMVDTSTWAEDRIDRRVEVPARQLGHELRSSRGR